MFKEQLKKNLFKKNFSKKFLKKAESLAQPYLDSFNWFLEEGFELITKSLPVVTIDEDTKIWFELLHFDTDYKSESPEQCRLKSSTYTAKLKFNIALKHHNKTTIQTFESFIPLMIKSNLCQLKDKNPMELAKSKEEAYEAGGYFIVKGNEKILRLLVVQKRNYPIAIERSSWASKGKGFTRYGCSIRCVAPDETYRTVNLHYLENGTCYFRLRIISREFFIPAGIILKALKRCTDREIYDRLTHKNENDTFIADRVVMELNEVRKYNVNDNKQCLEFLGKMFSPLMDNFESEDLFEAGQEFLKRYLFVHLDDNLDKFNLLILMIEKVYSLIQGKIVFENPDSIMNHEVLLPTNVYSVLVKNELLHILTKAKGMFKKMIVSEQTRKKATSEEILMERIQKIFVPQFEGAIKSFFATGTMPGYKDIDVPQMKGLVIMLDRISYLRMVASYRGVHRGSFFAESKMTSVRKLMPENWGFLCPVHTPDGPPCGILNHLTATCKVLVTKNKASKGLPLLLNSLGMTSISEGVLPNTFIPVVLDGKLLGGVSEDTIDSFVNELRILKVNGGRGVPQDIEFSCIKPGNKLFPIMVIWTGSSRFSRPVLNVELNKVEWIGTFEQVFLDIACLETDLCYGTAKYRELSPSSILSHTASFTPLSDFNQSPRNMYQCQMAKQTLAFPVQNYYNRWDTKLYVLSTPQLPIMRTQAHNDFKMDHYPSGTNVMCAVISYTGFDMEDAMIINKGSWERGIFRAFVYKSYKVNLLDGYEKYPKKPYFKGLSKEAIEKSKYENHFKKTLLTNLLGDGLSEPGTRLENGMPFYSYFDPKASDREENIVIEKWKGENAVVDQVVILESQEGFGPCSVIFKTRIDRAPVLGDKFASRSGQKGTLAMLYPQEDMPFTESGMYPDLIINPHAFPSRMTIGMLIESMASKSGAVHGMFQNGSPFVFGENFSAVDFYGEQLKKAGYNYYGNEPLYSGILGTEMHADIYIGSVYYQRLRHMVLDKWQVRGGTGSIDPIVNQPVGGRKKGGGVRFGEMERDSLIAHGSSYILKDRLMNSSDKLTSKVCMECGSIIAPLRARLGHQEDTRWTCKACDKKGTIKNISMPGSFLYLIAELASLNIRVNFNVKPVATF